MAKRKKKDKLETNSTVDDRERRLDLRCSFCKPNRGENRKTYRKHGVKKKRKRWKRKVKKMSDADIDKFMEQNSDLFDDLSK